MHERRKDIGESRGRVLALAVLLVAMAGCGGDATDEPRAATPTRAPSTRPATTVSPFPSSDEPVPIDPGTYLVPRSSWSDVDYTVTFPEGWTVQHGASYLKHPDRADGLGFEAFVPDTFYTDACEGSQGETMVVGHTVDELATALLEQRGPEASDPVETTLGGYPAVRIDLTVPKGFDLKACNLEGAGFQIWFSHPADGYLVLFADAVASVYIVDVDGERQVFQTQYGSEASDEDRQELEAIIDSIHIET